MTDIVTPEKRSEMMSGIREKNTRPEIIIRKKLHRAGFRFRLHIKSLPGKPDIVLRKYNTVIFVHGCFWHGHECKSFKWPKTRAEFWKKKIESNRNRDKQVKTELEKAGWRICTVWECAIRGKNRNHDKVADKLASWLKGQRKRLELKG